MIPPITDSSPAGVLNALRWLADEIQQNRIIDDQVADRNPHGTRLRLSPGPGGEAGGGSGGFPKFLCPSLIVDNSNPDSPAYYWDVTFGTVNGTAPTVAGTQLLPGKVNSDGTPQVTKQPLSSEGWVLLTGDFSTNPPVFTVEFVTSLTNTGFPETKSWVPLGQVYSVTPSGGTKQYLMQSLNYCNWIAQSLGYASAWYPAGCQVIVVAPVYESSTG